MADFNSSSSRLTNEIIVRACERHAEEMRYQAIRMSDLAQVSGASERRVRRAFYECRGVPPTAFLRTAALRQVRLALLAGPFDRDAVTRAATDFGFTHLSRFARHYRELFGEFPHETVTRARLSWGDGMGRRADRFA